MLRYIPGPGFLDGRLGWLSGALCAAREFSCLGLVSGPVLIITLGWLIKHKWQIVYFWELHRCAIFVGQDDACVPGDIVRGAMFSTRISLNLAAYSSSSGSPALIACLMSKLLFSLNLRRSSCVASGKNQNWK